MTAETHTDTEIAGHVAQMRAELQRMLDESQLQSHLLRMDLRDRLDALQRRHTEVHAAVGKARRETLESLRLAITELRESFAQIRHEASQPPPSTGKPERR